MDSTIEENPHAEQPRSRAWKHRLAERYRGLRGPQRVLLKLLTCSLFAGLIALCLFTAAITVGLPDVSELGDYNPAAGTKLYAADGTLIANLLDETRDNVAYKEISPIMVKAVVAIEDKRFFKHGGVDLRGVARAVVANLGAGGVQEGASTLTMQLARRLFLTDERTYTRKVREAVLAYRMDRALSKEKILELYLNEVYFGSGAYGVGAASALYFDKKPKDLQLWQSAMLAGLVQAPSAFSPLHDRAAALRRMDEVLSAMLSEREISQAEASQAREKAAGYRFVDRRVQKRESKLDHPYFTTYVIEELAERFPNRDLRRGGLQVVTSLNLGMQIEAERAMAQTLASASGLGADNGAVVALDNESGEISALVGGLEWSDRDQFNRATQARRQPGSSFKPFVYAAALEEGFNPEQEFADTAATFGPSSNPWTPSNSDNAYMGAIPMRTGLQFSRNIVAAKVLAHLGPDKVIALAHEMGIDSDLPPYVSLALGAGEVTPLQMARAYSSFPSGGVLRPVRSIRKVTNAQGEVLLDLTGQDEEKRVLGEDTARTMCELLKRVVDRGTGTAARLDGVFVGGKTGTTDNFADAWFVGFTPRHTLAVWIGRDDNQPMGTLYGGTYPAEVFARVAKMGMNGEKSMVLPGISFESPVQMTLCADSTYVASASCPNIYQEVFQGGYVAQRLCPIHRTDGQSNPRWDSEVVTSLDAVVGYSEQEPAVIAERSWQSAVVVEDAPATPAPSAPLPTSPPPTVYQPPIPVSQPDPRDVSSLEEELSTESTPVYEAPPEPSYEETLPDTESEPPGGGEGDFDDVPQPSFPDEAIIQPGGPPDPDSVTPGPDEG